MKSFVSVSNFTNDPSVSATHCQLPFQGSLKPSHFITLNLRTRQAVSLQRVLRNHKSRDKTHRIRVPEKAAPVELSWSSLMGKRFRNAFFFSPAFFCLAFPVETWDFFENPGFPPPPQKISGFPHRFPQAVENQCGEKISPPQEISRMRLLPLWNLLWRAVQRRFHRLWKPLPASAGFSTDFSTSFSFPLHNLSTIPPAKNLSTSPRFLHKGFVEEKSPQIPAKIRLSTFPVPL